MTTNTALQVQHLVIAVSGPHSTSTEIQGAPAGAMPSLHYVMRVTLRSLSLSGLFTAAKLTEISPGLIWCDFPDVDVDFAFAETVAREVHRRWAMVQTLDPASVSHVTVDRT